MYAVTGYSLETPATAANEQMTSIAAWIAGRQDPTTVIGISGCPIVAAWSTFNVYTARGLATLSRVHYILYYI